MMDVFSAKDMAQTRPRGIRKNATIQKVPGSAKIQNTAGFFRQLSKIEIQPLSVVPGSGRPARAARKDIAYLRERARRVTAAPPISSSRGDAGPGFIAQTRSLLADVDARFAFRDNLVGRED